MAYFTPDFLIFFQELAANNHKDWFHANKKRYETAVKQPFEAFVGDFIEKVRPHFDVLEVTAKQSIFRINKDIRFSKDKSPYKLNRSAAIAPGGRKDFVTPGVYLDFGPESTKLYGGFYKLDKQQLHNVRSYIIENNEEFRSILKSKGYKSSFNGLLHGEKNKIVPKVFKEAAQNEPYIFNKAFYYYNKTEPETILQEDLLEVMFQHFQNGKRMRDFLTKAIKGS